MLNVCQRAGYDVTSPPAWAWAENSNVSCMNSKCTKCLGRHQACFITDYWFHTCTPSPLLKVFFFFCNNVFIPSGLLIWAFRLHLSLVFKYFYETLSNEDCGFCPVLPFVPLEYNLFFSHSIMNKIPAGCKKGVCPSVQVLNIKVVQATVMVEEDSAVKGGASLNTAQC